MEKWDIRLSVICMLFVFNFKDIVSCSIISIDEDVNCSGRTRKKW